MSDAVARAVGAGSPTTVMIAGKQCTIRPLGIRELTMVERDCLQRFRRNYLETFAENADLLPRGGKGLLERKMDEVARWDVDNLPPKHAYDAATVKVTNELRVWVAGEHDDVDKDASVEQIQQLTAASLDSEKLSVAECQRLAGAVPVCVKIPYASWWITGSIEGMISFVWMCFKRNGVTRDEVADELSERPALLVELSRELERLSAPAVGNGSGSPA